MLVESIIYKKSCGDIVVAGDTYEGLSLESLYSYGIKKDMEIDEQTLADLLIDSEKRRCKEKALSLIGIKSRTEKELRIKLYERGFSATAVKYAMELMKEYNYISDEDFAAGFAEINSQYKGAYRIKRELITKGVDESVAENAVAEACQHEDETAAGVAERYMRGRSLEIKTKEKLFRHLMSRGFSYEVVKGVIRNYNFAESGDGDEY